MARRTIKFRVRNLFAVLLAILVFAGAIFGIVKITQKLTSKTKIISQSFVCGALNVEGEFVDSKTSIVTKDFFECQGLKIVKSGSSTIRYQVFFYDENKALVEYTEELKIDYEKTDEIHAKYARIVILPQFEDDDDEIKWYQVRKYAKQLTIEVNRKQNYKANENVETTSYEVAFYDFELVGTYTTNAMGKLTSFPSTPTPTNGFLFVGWYTTDDIEITENSIITANEECYALYKRTEKISGDDNTGDDNTGGDNTGGDNTGDDNTGDGETPDIPVTPSCTHVDNDNDWGCDNCGITYFDGDENTDMVFMEDVDGEYTQGALLVGASGYSEPFVLFDYDNLPSNINGGAYQDGHILFLIQDAETGGIRAYGVIESAEGSTFEDYDGDDKFWDISDAGDIGCNSINAKVVTISTDNGIYVLCGLRSDGSLKAIDATMKEAVGAGDDLGYYGGCAFIFVPVSEVDS